MVFEAILFMSGAVLFFLTVLFFVFLWQDRMVLMRRKTEIQAQLVVLQEQAAALKDQRVDMDIWERELRVWAEGVERQQRALEEAQEELRMLTASKQPPPPADTSPVDTRAIQGGEVVVVKNVKRQRDGAKMPK